jgi:tetratricopeptide (TPR) repeat protein
VALLRRRNAGDYCEQALRLLAAEYYPAALEATDKAIKLEPGHAQAHRLRGWALSEIDRHDEALDAYRQAVRLDPAMTDVHYQIARELHRLGRHAVALEAAETAIGLNPDDIAPFILRGAVLFDSGRWPEALESFTSVLERRPDLAQVRFDRAQVLRALGRYLEALADYNEALRLVPRFTARARIEHRAIYRDGARLVPASVTMIEQKAVTLAIMGQYDDATAEFEAAAALAGGHSSARADVWEAAVAWHCGDPLEARHRCELAAEKPMGAPSWESANLRAVISCALGDPGAAANLLRRCGNRADPATRELAGHLYDLLSDPPMPGIDQLRAIAKPLVPLESGTRRRARPVLEG